MLRFLKDPLVRRTLTATLFAVAFVWVAVRWFDVDTNVVWVFAILTLMFIAGLIALGFLFSFVLHWFMRRRNGMLREIEEQEKRLEEPEHRQPEHEDSH